MFGDLGDSVIWDSWWDIDESIKEIFLNTFDILKPAYMSYWLADNDFYQGLNVMSVIRRKSDGQLFGFQWWNDISDNGESYIEGNGDEHGYELDDSVADKLTSEEWDALPSIYVWTPVEEWSLKGYRHVGA
jgi:hypothetical protein